MIESINSYLDLIINTLTLIGIIASFIFFISGSAKKKYDQLISYTKEYSSNLPNATIDDFKFVDLKLRMPQSVNPECIAKTRLIYSSSFDSSEKIDAFSRDSKLELKYKFLKHNTDSWVNYSVRDIYDLGEYCNRGYYITFDCSSSDAKDILMEIKGGGFKAIPIRLNSECRTYFYSLRVNRPTELEEISFTIKPVDTNNLEGTITISNFKVVKKKICQKCGEKHTRSGNVVQCSCGRYLENIY